MSKKAPNLVLIPQATLVTFQGVTTKVKYDAKTKKTIPADDGKYVATLLIPIIVNIDYIKSAMQNAAAVEDANTPFAQWEKAVKVGNKIIEKNIKKQPDKSPERWAMYKDQWVIECRSTFPPAFSIPEGGRAKTLDESQFALIKSLFYSGCQVAAELNFVANKIDSGKDDADGNDIYNFYINAYHNSLLKIGDGPRLGRKSQDDIFKNVLGGKTTANPTAGDEDF